MFGGLLNVDLSENRTLNINDLSLVELFEDPISEDWITPVLGLSHNHYSFVKLSGYQEFLFDRYMRRLDDAIEEALDTLEMYEEEDIDLIQDLEKSADEIKGIFNRFIQRVFSTIESILAKVDTNQELTVAFYVMYTIYGQMRDDFESRIHINGYNPLFYKTLRDFVTLYIEVFHENLPLPDALRECLFQEEELKKCLVV